MTTHPDKGLHEETHCLLNMQCITHMTDDKLYLGFLMYFD